MMGAPYTFQIKNPEELDINELESFCAFVKGGGQVVSGVAKRLKEIGKVIVLVRLANELAAVGALKVPMARYRSNVFKSAAAVEQPTDYPIELGWVVVAERHRKQGLSSQIVKVLLEVSDSEQANVYATSDVEKGAMHRSLERNGFVKAGAPYRSELDNDRLQLFVRKRFPEPH